MAKKYQKHHEDGVNEVTFDNALCACIDGIIEEDWKLP